MDKQKPRLVHSGLTGKIYVTTEYKEIQQGAIVSTSKFDVSDDFWALAAVLFPDQDIDAVREKIEG